MWSYYAVDHLFNALELDYLNGSHPIEVSVGPASEIAQIFDAISYCKGSAIIRMLCSHVGEAAFVQGLRSYLQEFKYANARTSDLWTHLAKSSRMDIPRITHEWTKKCFYPLIEVNFFRRQ